MRTSWGSGIFGAVWMATRLVYAVVPAGGDGTGNTTAPADDPGFSRIGRLSNRASSVTYLSNGWFMTAYHVQQLDKISGHPGPTGVVLGGVTYSVDDTSWTRLTNIYGTADATLFRVKEAVSYSGPALSVRSASASGSVTMIGDGLTRYNTLTYWATNTAGTWMETNSASAMATGYKLNTGSGSPAIRWGTNAVSNTAFLNPDATYGTSVVFRTQFDDRGGDEAQGVLFDSGGAVFIKNGGTWQLAGMMVTVDAQASFATLPGLGSNKVVYDMGTRSLDLAYYRPQILTTIAIPEPGAIAGLVGGLIGGGLVRRLRRRQRKTL